MNDVTMQPGGQREAYLEAIVHSATVAIITVDEAQNIVLFNPAAELVFGVGAAQVIGASLERFIPTTARASHRRHVTQFGGTSEGGARAMGGDRILKGLRADGSEFPVDASISIAQVDGRKLYTVFLRDVTRRVRDQDMLQRYSNIVDSSGDAILSRSAEGTVLTWNPAAERLFGYTHEEIIGRPVETLYSLNTPPEARDLSGRAARGESIVNFETLRRRRDGSDVAVAITISPLRDREGRLTGSSAIFRDITERKRMEAELHALIGEQRRAEAQLRESRDRLRELSTALQTIREEEKMRIARELHDELGQALTALKMDASAIASELQPGQEALAKRAHGMKQLIDATVSSVRRISADLRPVMLDNLGLAPTLEWLARDFSARTGIHVDLDVPSEDLGVNGDAATAIFRIVQEALTNVARHSGANEVFIEVMRSNGNVIARMRDNGRGIAEPDARKSRSFGLLGMRERAYVLGGNLVVSRVPSGGTQIEAVIPAFGITHGT